MENKAINGIHTFVKFAKEIPEGSSNFDYFALLDHISQTKMDRDLMAAIFCESKWWIKNFKFREQTVWGDEKMSR